MNLAASIGSEDAILDNVLAQIKQMVQKKDDNANILPNEEKEMLPIDDSIDDNHKGTSMISKRDRRLPCIHRDSWGRCRRYKKVGLWGKRNFN